ncbi:MAG: ATP-dependent RNA helicase DeaD [Flavobacterium sp.]|jgi:ATP-dependent RNA helicase DeaD
MSDSKPEPMSEITQFSDLNLPDNLLKALAAVGYETPSPIQAQTIPPLMEGADVLGHAPTGTGKTAAFALPLLSRLDMTSKHVQIMILAPTRELAIQVSEALLKYAAFIKGFNVLPIYGGQPYSGQIHQLKRGVQAVVGTPGRVMDHMRKGTLKLDNLQALVLDEADEMLRMGFIDDVEWILEQTPEKRQIALFSATMPTQIKKIAQRYLNNPIEIKIKTKTATADTIRQRYWLVSHLHKLDALTRILEVEPFDAMLMFVRTKTATVELAEKLKARGYSVAPLNGDIIQKQREQTVERLKSGALDIIVATDVAARGLDVSRISHVINYDIPYDTESYIHRIGRTGRAGREGDAILFVAPREQRMLKTIERATNKTIDRLELPTTEMVNNKRIATFKQSITDTIAAGGLDFVQNILSQYEQEHDTPAIEVAAALAKMFLGNKSLLLVEKEQSAKKNTRSRNSESRNSESRNSEARNSENKGGSARPPRRSKSKETPAGMAKYRIEVGHDQEVQPGNIVGAIANEAGLDASDIGSIDIQDDHSFVDLPEGMPRDVFRDLKKAWVCGRRMNISKFDPVARKKREEEGTEDKKRKDRGDKRKPRLPSGEKKKSDKKPEKKLEKKKKRKPNKEA